MAQITQNRAIPRAQRVRVFLDAPEGSIMHMKSRRQGKCKAMHSAIDYAIDRRERNATIPSTDMASNVFCDFEADENAVVWWAQKDVYLAKDFREKILRRSLMTFEN